MMKEKMGVLLTCEKQEMHTILQLENLKGRDYLEDLYIQDVSRL